MHQLAGLAEITAHIRDRLMEQETAIGDHLPIKIFGDEFGDRGANAKTLQG